MRTFLASIREEDLTRHIEGVTDEGTAYVDLIWHSMMHVLFHGAQHRSEAAEIVTEYGFSPGELDFFRINGNDEIISLKSKGVFSLSECLTPSEYHSSRLRRAPGRAWECCPAAEGR